MSLDTRQANRVWTVTTGGPMTWDAVHTALLMDLRDELQRLNRLLSCGNFTGIPTTLRAIQRNTAKRRRTSARKARS